MNYKGYRLPADFLLLIRVFGSVLSYSRLVHKKSLPDIIGHIKESAAQQETHAIPTAEEYLMLDKVYRAANFLLLRIIRTPKPCLPRSLTLFHWCVHQGISTRLIIGIKKSQQLLEGHSWLLIAAKPFREDEMQLQEYTIMLEGNHP